MFISQLKNSLNTYDRFYEHRINGLKAVFVLELLFLFNFIYTIPNPYFYYFYIPLTAFAAEVAGNTLSEKYLFYFYTVIGSIITIFLFGVISSYKSIFVIFVFFYSLFIYLIAVYKFKNIFIPAPIILSLGAYSLIYGLNDSNFYIALNHALQTIVAMIIVFIGLLFFPKYYYFCIWRNGFDDVLTKIEELTAQISQGNHITIPIIPGTIIMERYSKMLSSRTKKFSILKITLLSFDLVMSVSYLASFQNQLRAPYIIFLHRYILALKEAYKKRMPLSINEHDLQIFNETHELKVLHQLILSWNYLCYKN